MSLYGRVRSQSLLFRSVFSLALRIQEATGGAVSRNPFYSGRFFHSAPFPERSVLADARKVAIPSIQVGFFTRLRQNFIPATSPGRNPFYSGRFFHSVCPAFPDHVFCRSQSLLFRSVFSLPPHGGEIRPAHPEVAIPSIQVGFFTPDRSALLANAPKCSRNPFYSGRFFHSAALIRNSIRWGGRNPFYSGRFFHSGETGRP